MTWSFTMRPALFLIIALSINLSITQLQAQESSFLPGEITSAINSVATATSSVLDQQAIGTGLDDNSALFDVAATGETITLPDATTYSEPNFAGSNDVQFPLAPAARRSGGWLHRANEHLRQASINAPTEGITISFLGGYSYANEWIDGFGRTVGDSFRTGNAIGFSVGKRFSPTFRMDLELSWRNAERGGYIELPARSDGLIPLHRYESELRNFSGMLNIYHDFNRPPGSFLTPYIGGGLGATKQDFLVDYGESSGIPNFEDSDTGAAIQGMIGVSANVTAHNQLFVEQRSFSITENNFSKTTNSTIFGWRHTF